MRSVLCVLFSLFAVTSASAQNPAATTITGTATNGTNQTYTFTSGSGQVTATLSWDTQGANLFMVLVCGSSDALTYAAAAGLLDRFARFESGVPGHTPCVVGVSSAHQTANYRLHVIRSIDQALTSASASGFVALTAARGDSRRSRPGAQSLETGFALKRPRSQSSVCNRPALPERRSCRRGMPVKGRLLVAVRDPDKCRLAPCPAEEGHARR